MCRQKQVWGLMSIAFGLGLLIGMWLEGGFLAHCFGFGLILLGCGILRKN